MFSAWPISISLAVLATAVHFCDRERPSRTKSVALAGLIASAYCFLAGLDMLQGWTNPLAEIPGSAAGRVAVASHGKGGILLLLISVWPYALMVAGGYAGHAYWITLGKWPFRKRDFGSEWAALTPERKLRLVKATSSGYLRGRFITQPPSQVESMIDGAMEQMENQGEFALMVKRISEHYAIQGGTLPAHKLATQMVKAKVWQTA